MYCVNQTDAASRSNVPINLTPKARAIVEGLKQETGVVKQESVARVLEWFASQSKEFRLAVVTNLGDPIEQLIQARMAELTEAGQVPLTFDQAQAMVHRLVDHMTAIQKATRREIEDQPGKVKKQNFGGKL